MKLGREIWESIVANPIAWLLLLFLAISIHGNAHKGEALRRLCKLTGNHDISTAHPRKPADEIDNICIEETSEDEPDNQ